ncbi:MAG TPA: hypothetical protein VFH08_20250 [Chitinophagaceae bacterium]|nr:hypothetical protein [Chitinophagaceae bacterium]
MVKYILFILLSGKLLSCNNNIQTNEQSSASKSADTSKMTPAKPAEEPVADLAGCYMKILGRDTAILLLEQKGKEFSGKMLYDNYEKDGSRGTVKGKEDGEIIKLWYDFNSEGMHSVMEVYFRKESGRLLRGVGSMDAKTDTTYFISGINYSDKEAFTKVDCSLVEWKLKF